jgi:hypothetical protein
MKTNLLLLASIASVSLLLLGFTSREPHNTRTEDYALIVRFGFGELEKTVNGKTEYIKLEGQKIEGQPGKNTTSALVQELEKLNELGFEIVNVSQDHGNMVREVYLFKRKR